MQPAKAVAVALGIVLAVWPVTCLAYFGLYGGYTGYASPYRSYGYPYSFAASLGLGYFGSGVGGLSGLYGLYGLSGLSGLGLSGLGFYGPGLFGTGLYGLGLYGSGLYGLGTLGLYGLGKQNGLQSLSGLFGSSGLNELRSYGLQLLASGGLGNPGWQSLLLAAMFSSPVPETVQTASTAATATADAVITVPVI
ncbi:MAG: hypothetical protein AB1611_13855 [bacterium]